MDPGARFGGREFDPSEPVRSFWATTKEVCLDPRGFFSRLPTFSSPSRALLFGMICLVIGTVCVVAFSAISGGWPAAQNPVLSGIVEAGPARTLGAVALYAMFWPLLALLQLCVVAGVAHLLVVALMKERLGFVATLRVVCYASVTSLLSWIPLLGWLVELYGLYLIVVGLRRVHGHDPRSARSI